MEKPYSPFLENTEPQLKRIEVRLIGRQAIGLDRHLDGRSPRSGRHNASLHWKYTSALLRSRRKNPYRYKGIETPARILHEQRLLNEDQQLCFEM